MGFVFIVSILLKGIGAVLEVVLQVVITNQIGVADYGVYSTLINAADLIYWCLFSGMVKCNTFYLAESGTTIRRFKTRYYLFYVLPVSLGGMVISLLLNRPTVCIVFATGMAELLVMDHSSSFMARGYCKRALFGEYVLGRFLLLTGAAAAFAFSASGVTLLLLLYLAQFLLVKAFFLLQERKMPQMSQEQTVSLKKWGNYQRADIIQSMIGQMPVIIQYLFVGSFEAGVVSVVMLVKKLVNFISGPSFKVFLPEFSRMYQANDRAGIKRSFASIIRMQMLFLAPMSVALIGYPQVLLGIMAEELTQYTRLFIFCAATFIVIASIGPCSGLMQMTGNERMDNLFREIALAGMLLVFVLLRSDPFFVLYGLCAQTILENIGKVLFVSRWMGGFPMRISRYLSLWILPGAMISIIYLLRLEHSIAAMFFLCAAVFFADLVYLAKTEDLLEMIKNRKARS